MDGEFRGTVRLFIQGADGKQEWLPLPVGPITFAPNHLPPRGSFYVEVIHDFPEEVEFTIEPKRPEVIEGRAKTKP